MFRNEQLQVRLPGDRVLIMANIPHETGPPRTKVCLAGYSRGAAAVVFAAKKLYPIQVDYLILFAHETQFLADKFNQPESKFANRRITGVQPYIYTHVACTKNAWGKAVIKQVDALLERELATPEYRKFSERWYNADDQARVRRFYPQMLKDAR